MNGTANRISRSTGKCFGRRQLDRLLSQITIVPFQFVQVLAQLDPVTQAGQRFVLLANGLLQIRGAGAVQAFRGVIRPACRPALCARSLRCELV